MADFTAIAAYTAFGLGVFNAGINIYNAWTKTKESARTRQRGLRDQLLTILRKAREAQVKEFNRLTSELSHVSSMWCDPTAIAVAAEDLEMFRQEKLFSPNDKHVALLIEWMRTNRKRFRFFGEKVKASNINQDPEFVFNPEPALCDPLESALDEGDRLLNKYIDVCTAIQNGSYITYLKYRFLGPRRKDQPRPVDQLQPSE